MATSDIILNQGEPNPPDIRLGPLTNFGWIQPFSDPVRVPAALSNAARSSLFSFVPLVVSAAISLDWLAPLSEPVRYDQVLGAEYQPHFAGSGTIPPSVSTDFLSPFSEPVRVRLFPKANQQTFTTDWNVRVNTDFLSPFSEPVRVSIFPRANQQFFTTDWNVPAVLVSHWHEPFSEPVRSKQAVAWQQPFTMDWQWSAPVPISDLRDFWFSPLAEPVRSKMAVAYQQPFTVDWKWTLPPLTFTLLARETGDAGIFRYAIVITDYVIGADVTITEISFDDTANVTITEIDS